MNRQYAYIGVSTEPLYPQLAEKLGLVWTKGRSKKTGVEGGLAGRGRHQGQ